MPVPSLTEEGCALGDCWPTCDSQSCPSNAPGAAYFGVSDQSRRDARLLGLFSSSFLHGCCSFFFSFSFWLKLGFFLYKCHEYSLSNQYYSYMAHPNCIPGVLGPWLLSLASHKLVYSTVLSTIPMQSTMYVLRETPPFLNTRR